MSKHATKERLFEVTARLDKTFKPRLNEVSYANNIEEFKNLVAVLDNKQFDAAKQMLDSIINNDNLEALKAYLAEMGEYETQSWVTNNASMSEAVPENLAVSPVGGVVEKTELNEASSISPIHNYVYFAYNFPSDFIKRAWAEDPNMVQHLESKFAGFYKQYGPKGVMNTFYTELDNENQKILEDWIMANYHG